jgi:prephenate dehydratase
MKKIAVLGPESTFSEVAAQRFIDKQKEPYLIQFFPTLKKVFAAVGEQCDCAILPIENMVEGYVLPVLDLQLHGRLTIVDEIVVPVGFSFVAKCSSLDLVKRVFVQFVSRDQCADFLESLPPEVEVVVTQSNGESLLRVREGAEGDGAVVTRHALASSAFACVVENVNDYEGNKTRFIAVAEQEAAHDPARAYKTSIAIMEGQDRPGMLADILHAFSKRHINLVSIMSRPTRDTLGKYNFFIDVEGYARDGAIRDALADARKCGYVKVLGSYPRAAEPLQKAVAAAPADIPCLRVNPFVNDGHAPEVFVVKGDDAYAATREALAKIDLAPARGKKVLLKPNVGRLAEAGSGVVTNPRVVAAAIDAFVKAGAVVAVGESPITGVKMAETFETSGVAAVARERGVPCLDMDRRPAVEVALADGVALDAIKVCADLFDFDILVSIPVMKIHMHTGVTLAVKNMKGCLWSRSKIDLHMLPNIPFCDDKPLNVAIADMASVLRPHLSIIDGSIGMEGLGPGAGVPKPLGVIVVGVDPFAADSAACALMGVDARKIPHLRIGGERGYGVIDLDKINVAPPDWKRWAQPFAPVPTNVAIEFPNVKVLDEMSCSACQSTVFLFLKRYGAALGDYASPDKPLSIVIGKGHKSVPPNSICVGNCTRAFRELGTYVPGCPPVASSIMRAMEKKKGEKAGE